MSMDYDNEMKEPRLVKCVVNIGVGQGGEKLRKAFDVLEMLTNQEPIETTADTTNADFGIREGQPVGCKVTLRGERAYDFLNRAFWVREDSIPETCFDERGNFSFGIEDYTDFEGVSYDPEIGIFGMDISVEMARKGYRIKKRKKKPKELPKSHQLSKDESIEFVEESFDVEVY